jgi:lipopolysaccharide export LptBFGC system permease protein LptF
VSPEDLRGWRARDLLAAVLALAVVLALVVVALVDWLAA